MIITLRENGRSHDRAEEENKTGERRTEENGDGARGERTDF